MATYKSLADGLNALINSAKAKLSIKSQSNLAQFMANQAVAIILKRTRSGYGVAQTGGSIQPLAALSSTYIDFRRQTRRRLSAFTSPAKSNLTFSGELLYSLGNKKKGNSSWVITAQGSRDNGLSNEQLAKYVSRYRPFLNLSKGELDQILSSARKNFKDLVKS